MKFRVTVSFEYEVSEEDAARYYETTDPEAMARIDQVNYQEDLKVLFEDMASHRKTVVVVPIGES